MKRCVRWVLGLLGVLALVAAGALGWCWFRLEASLPRLDGPVRLAGLSAAVTVERDALGVPTIRAGSRVDAARATGYLHAQDRFFQMDMLRRVGAGELAELFGEAALPADRRLRVHGLRMVASRAREQMPPSQAALLDAYTEGVNAGLKALGAPPPEYLLLRSAPRPWVSEDTFLVAYAMFFDLQESDGAEERWLGVMRDVLPPEAWSFFVPLGTDWDAALDGSVLPAASVPGPGVFSFRRAGAGGVGKSASHEERIARQVVAGGRSAPAGGWGSREAELVPGSNSWAVDGGHTTTGAALVANDMHLGLNLPVIWYRVRIICTPATPPAEALDVCGVSLPGSPLVVVGSNGHLAWSFTNAAVDNSDVVLIERSPDDAAAYRTPDGWRRFEVREEVLGVHGGASETLRVTNTIWGPLMGRVGGGEAPAVRWVAHVPGAANLRLIELETIRDTAAALALAPECGIPVMNFVAGDRAGQVGWTLCGRLPRRVGFDGRTPASWADGAKRWDGLLGAELYPRVVSAPNGRLWTANNRVAGDTNYLRTGPWSVDLGARARQIRDDLMAVERAGAADMLKIQLDDRALFLERWRRLLVTTLSQPELSNQTTCAAMRREVEQWGGRAAPESAGYLLVREFRSQAIRLVLAPLTALCRARDPEFGYGAVQVEQPVWAILEQRPSHLLNPGCASFDALLAEAARAAGKACSGGANASGLLRWGERNRVFIRHPLSRAVPWVSRWLDLPPLELPGDTHMPRVQGRGFGASERLAVSPGHESEGYLHVPGGQSGHPLSPFYRAGYEAWVAGEPAPFLPGAARHHLALMP